MSQNAKKKSNQKIPLIIDCTLSILRDQGEQGLSMRKVAAKAGMSLGNLQYYFKNKDALLAGVVEEYFGRCGDHYSAALAKSQPTGKRESIEFLVRYGMEYADSEIGMVFRELWGMAARNEIIESHMHAYYRVYEEELVKVLTPYAKKPGAVSRVVSLLIPFYEGYGLTSSTLPSDKEEVVAFLVNIVESSM